MRRLRHVFGVAHPDLTIQTRGQPYADRAAGHCGPRPEADAESLREARVPQRGVISPLLSNVYLTEVDAMLERAKAVDLHAAS
jgi:hypothetical protein